MPPLTEQIQALFDQFPQVLSQVALAILILLAAIILSAWLGRVVSNAARRRKADTTLQEILRRLVRWGILILGLVLAAEQVIPNVTSLLAGLGIAGFTIGFALQDVAKNLIAGILLLLQQPFEIGDTIEVTGFTGKVVAIELRTTNLRANDGLFVTIPNADVYANPIINYSRAPIRRVEISIPIAYGADLEKALELASQAVEKVEGLITDPGPQITFQRMGDAYLGLEVWFWADMRQVDFLAAKDQAVRTLERTFAAQGIEVAPPSTISLVNQN